MKSVGRQRVEETRKGETKEGKRMRKGDREDYGGHNTSWKKDCSKNQ